MITGIYKITNLIDGKIYIGQSRNIEQRFQQHKLIPFRKSADDYDKVLYQAIREYGLDNFQFEIIEECKEEELNQKENYYIDFYKSNNPDYGYNKTTTPYYVNNIKITQDLLQQIIQDIKNSDLLIKDIAEKYNLHSNTITAINTGKSYYNSQIKYPIRKIEAKIKYCKKCGKIITQKAEYCSECSHTMSRTIERPTREKLKELIREKSFLQIAKIYNVSDNAIRKWCDSYNLPRKKTEINNYSDEQWQTI